MNISTSPDGAATVVTLAGRLDGEAALQVAATLERLLRDGRRSVVLDMSGVSYLSSPGTQALQQALQDYTSARGELHVTSPSPVAAEALAVADLLPKLLIQPGALDGSASVQLLDQTRDDWRSPTAAAPRGVFEVSTREPGAELSCHVHGRPDAGVQGWIDSTDYGTFEFPEASFGLGMGALGEGRTEAGPRLGEIVAAGGAVAHLPTLGAQVPDFDVGLGGHAPKAVLVSGLVCRGGFSLLKRFSSPSETEPVPLSELASATLDGAGSETAGVVMVAEASGLVGAWLRRSPGTILSRMQLDVQGVRDWLGTTPQPTHQGTTVLVAGVVSRQPDERLAPRLRPVAAGSDLFGHFHAVVFTYRPVPQRTVVLRALVTRLFGQQRVRGVLHLLGDDRGAAGSGESTFRRGLCWAGPITRVTTA
ncbi:MAG: STAS domain-containing protein [Gemmatimonadales bacterium]